MILASLGPIWAVGLKKRANAAVVRARARATADVDDLCCSSPPQLNPRRTFGLGRLRIAATSAESRSEIGRPAKACFCSSITLALCRARFSAQTHPKFPIPTPPAVSAVPYSQPATAIPLLLSCPVLLPRLICIFRAPLTCTLFHQRRPFCSFFSAHHIPGLRLVTCCLGDYRLRFFLLESLICSFQVPQLLFSPSYPAATQLLEVLLSGRGGSLHRNAPSIFSDAQSASSMSFGTSLVAGPTALQAISSLGSSPGPQAEILRFPETRNECRGKACAACSSLRSVVFLFKLAFMLTRVSVVDEGRGDIWFFWAQITQLLSSSILTRHAGHTVGFNCCICLAPSASLESLGFACGLPLGSVRHRL